MIQILPVTAVSLAFVILHFAKVEDMSKCLMFRMANMFKNTSPFERVMWAVAIPQTLIAFSLATSVTDMLIAQGMISSRRGIDYISMVAVVGVIVAVNYLRARSLERRQVQTDGGDARLYIQEVDRSEWIAYGCYIALPILALVASNVFEGR
jgi:hypothetical protein